jgi:hypothetical protein
MEIMVIPKMKINLPFQILGLPAAAWALVLAVGPTFQPLVLLAAV